MHRSFLDDPSFFNLQNEFKAEKITYNYILKKLILTTSSTNDDLQVAQLFSIIVHYFSPNLKTTTSCIS